jgi:hypothetical protein
MAGLLLICPHYPNKRCVVMSFRKNTDIQWDLVVQPTWEEDQAYDGLSWLFDMWLTFHF